MNFFKPTQVFSRVIENKFFRVDNSQAAGKKWYN